MISIIEHIEYLVLRHDCVVVPGLGALIAHHTPASIDSELECIFPPRRSITFNAELVHNDGLLISSVARRHRLTYDQAAQIVTDCVNAMRYQLQQEGETGLGHLGVLSLSEEGVPTFEPFESADVSPRYIGLSAVKATPLSLHSSAQHVADENSQTTEASGSYAPVRRGILQVAAAMVALIMLGLMLSTPIVDNRAMRASMAPSIERSKSSACDELKTLDSRTRRLTLAIAMPDSTYGTATVITTPIVKREGPAPVESIRCDATDRYFLVVASLPSAYKASEYIEEHPNGNEMHLLECDGRYRIYVATGKTFEAARRPMSQEGFSDRYPQAWVCRR
ncbi:hypothetical protein [Muribaculum intestinale]|uniref:HU domain-containing protein n=1 Tax=Muribaculum intestinale TaxID=1796646 RepID=UPI00241F465C|nr:hypothetical protein [Muribaculum intestinale]